MQQDSLEELMAQFRQLETASASKPDAPFQGNSGDQDYFCLSPKQGHMDPAFRGPVFSWKNRTTWYPYLLIAGGLLVFVTILTAIFRPSFLYNESRAFLWKRFFLTILFTYLLLLGSLYGLYHYAVRL